MFLRYFYWNLAWLVKYVIIAVVSLPNTQPVLLIRHPLTPQPMPKAKMPDPC